MTKTVVVVSAFIPAPGKWNIQELTLEESKKLVEKADNVEVYTQHQTVKLIGLEPDSQRKTYSPNGEIQLWLKPNSRLEFGREYSLEELQEIGVTPYLAIPIEE